MKENIFQFIDVPRIEPIKKSIKTRRKDFVEIYQPFSHKQAKVQADRCIDCGNPYCGWKCPVHNYIPNWLQLAFEGKIKEAAELAHQTNSLPEVCGRICPQDRLCEGACTLNDRFGAVTIGSIEKYIVDEAFKQGWRPDLSGVIKQDKKVAIIGAGPAGLSCADVLARQGIQAVVFDRYPEIGGLLTFGIPAFKLEKSVMQLRREIFEGMGIEFKLNTEIGRDIAFDQLLQAYDAVFIGTGAYHYVDAALPNQDHDNVYHALDFLIANTAHLMKWNAIKPYVNFKGKRVVVLGGGDTAMDCVRSAIRQQAKTVKCLYRRDEVNMPGSAREVQHAKEEGVEFVWNMQPVRVALDDGGKVSGVYCHKTEKVIGKKVSRDQFNVHSETEIFIDADAVVMAFGFRPEPLQWMQDVGIGFDTNSRIEVGQKPQFLQQTSNPKIFAGGDAVLGADLVVTAVDQGRKAARDIAHYLSGNLLNVLM